jgi:hypothetical protein
MHSFEDNRFVGLIAHDAIKRGCERSPQPAIHMRYDKAEWHKNC